MRDPKRIALFATLGLSSVASAQAGRFVVGEATVYRIDYSNATRSDMRALFGMDTTQAIPSTLVHNIQSEVHGSLEQKVLRRDSVVHAVYMVRDAAVKLVVNGQTSTESEQEIAAHLAKPIFVTLASTGKIISVRFDPALNELSRSFARTLLSSIQFVAPPKFRSPDAWRFEEEDPAGVYVAAYAKAGPVSYVKTKLRYRSQRSQARKGEVAVSQVILPGGSVTATFAGALISLNGDEKQRVTVADRTIATGETKLRLQRVRVSRVDQAELDSMRAVERKIAGSGRAQGLYAAESEPHADTTIQRTELGDATLGTLTARLHALEAGSDTAASADLYLKLKALVYLHPESSAQLGQLLERAPANGPAILIISQALGTAGHAQAQAALVNAIRARASDWPALATLIPVLGGVREPSDQSVKTILDLAFTSTNAEITSTARLAAGTMARSIEVVSPARAAVIVRRLVAALDSATTTPSKRDLLFAVGNSGSSLALPSIERLARNPDQSLRAASLFALRWIESARADRLLERALRSDPDSTVRAAATRAIEERQAWKKR